MKFLSLILMFLFVLGIGVTCLFFPKLAQAYARLTLRGPWLPGESQYAKKSIETNYFLWHARFVGVLSCLFAIAMAWAIYRAIVTHQV